MIVPIVGVVGKGLTVKVIGVLVEEQPFTFSAT